MANIFISYQRSDTLMLAQCLRYALRAGGHEPFLDTGAIPPGVAFAPFIDEAIARSELVLVLIGPSFAYERLSAPNSVLAFEWRRARFHGCAVVPVLADAPAFASDRVPGELRWLPALNARLVSTQSITADIDELVAAVPALARRPRPSARVLWIDDDPKFNLRERRYLRTQGVSFDNVVSTEEAVEQLRNAAYDLVITDLTRFTLDEQSRTAGLDALQWVIRAGGPPVIVYSGKSAVSHRNEVLRLGAFGSTNDPSELYALVNQALGRTLPPDGADLQR